MAVDGTQIEMSRKASSAEWFNAEGLNKQLSDAFEHEESEREQAAVCTRKPSWVSESKL